MIKSIEFHNFKALRETTLPLERFTLLLGPNGSGKSSALQAIQFAQKNNWPSYPDLVSVGNAHLPVRFVFSFDHPKFGSVSFEFKQDSSPKVGYFNQQGSVAAPSRDYLVKLDLIESFQIFTFDPTRIATPASLITRLEVPSNGEGLAVVLDTLRNKHEDRFEALEAELARALPEFDAIKFDTSPNGQRAFLLRTRDGKYKVPASSLSHGTLLLIAILTLAHIPEPPAIIGIEEPERGVHPRLLRVVQDALYRLSYPEDFKETRKPIQVIATSHSPYFLDLFKHHPEEIVIAEKQGVDATFKSLKDRADIDEILMDSALGEVWYSGVLGGVPALP